MSRMLGDVVAHCVAGLLGGCEGYGPRGGQFCEQTLDLCEGSFEQYGVGGTYTAKLFAELCRSRGLLPYRHRRLAARHEALWWQFLELSRQLEARLHEVASAFLNATVAPPKLQAAQP